MRQADTFARLQVSDPSSGQEGSVDLAADLRAHPVIQLSGGPVLAEGDAVGNKTAAVFSRGEARDYLDLAAILASGRYNHEVLMTLAADADGGFDRAIFAQALAGVDRFPTRNSLATVSTPTRSRLSERQCAPGASNCSNHCQGRTPIRPLAASTAGRPPVTVTGAQPGPAGTPKIKPARQPQTP